MLLPNQGRNTLGKVLGEMKISTAKKQVLHSIAGVFLCNAVLHKWWCPGGAGGGGGAVGDVSPTPLGLPEASVLSCADDSGGEERAR